MRQLVKHSGIEVNVIDFRGTTPLHWAAVSDRADIAVLLWQAGGELLFRDNDGMTPQHYAVQKGFTECAEILAELASGMSYSSPFLLTLRIHIVYCKLFPASCYFRL